MNKIAVIDFETTGIRAAEILQAACIDGNNNTLLNELCKPEFITEWKEAQHIHGISPERVRGKPGFNALVPIVETILNDADIVLAYNAGFELSLLKQYGVKLRHTAFIDPMLMFAPIYGEWNSYHNDYRWQKLITAAQYYGYEFDAHDALADVKATLYIYNRMIDDGVSPEYVSVPAVAV